MGARFIRAALRWFYLAAWAGDSDADMQVTLLGDQLGGEQKKRALGWALRWKFKRDMNSIIADMVNTTEFFSEEPPSDQDDDDLP